MADDDLIFRKWGNGHITFNRLDPVEKMNEIVAKHDLEMLLAK